MVPAFARYRRWDSHADARRQIMRSGVPIAILGVVGLAASLIPTPTVAQDLRFACAADHDGAITAEQAQGCAERRPVVAREGAKALAEEQLAAALDADSLQQQFAQADRDGDGQISRDEWMLWFGRAYAEATKANEAR
jgi:EF hand